MKSTSTLILFLLVFTSLFAQTRYDVRFLLDGHMRECIIVRPSTPPPPGGYPVVFMLHGTSGDGEKFYNISEWKELGESENFMTVFPSSLTWCFVEDGIEKRNTRWVNGNVTENPCSSPQNYVDDVKFLKLLARQISDTFPVNRSRIFASGFSNGCSMIHKLAIDAGDVFAACAGGSAPLTMIDSARPVKRVPTWYILGSLDDRYIKPPYTELPFGGDSILIYLQAPIRRMLGCQGLTESFIKTETPITHTYTFSESQPGETSQPYLFTLIKGMGHEFPNGSNFPIDAPRIFWDFFNRSVTVAADNQALTKIAIAAWPNPSGDYIRIECLENLYGNARFELYDLTGRSVLSGRIDLHEGLFISKSQCGAGHFILRVFDDRSVWQKSLIFK